LRTSRLRQACGNLVVENEACTSLRTPSDGISVRYAALLPPRRLSAGPAHALVEIRVSQSGSGQQVRERVFAESWWGEQVQPPPVFDRVRWLLSRAPRIALLHVVELARLHRLAQSGRPLPVPGEPRSSRSDGRMGRRDAPHPDVAKVSVSQPAVSEAIKEATINS
jgi:hypothetical protein